MKILHNFDTKLLEKDYKWCVQRFWKDKVLVIQRSRYYWILKWLIPFLLLLIFTFLSLWAFSKLKQDVAPIAYIILFVWLIIFIFWIHRIYRVYLDYKMDFTIITPEEIISHKQKGIFKRNYKVTPAKQIRSIQSRHTGFWWNLMNFGVVTFLIDWSATNESESDVDRHWAGKIQLTYVSKPNKKRRLIMWLCLYNKSLSEIEVNIENDKK